jgi:hypothetical protein
MNELVMMEAALFQLRASLSEDSALMPVRISADLVAGAVAAAKADGVNPARVNDILFALNDLVAAVDEAQAPAEVLSSVAMLQSDAEVLRSATALPRDLIEGMRQFKSRLRTRATAMERGQYRAEDSPEATLPHPPAELREIAIPLLRQLAAAGFDTPVLAGFVADPDEMRYHTINDIVDELDAIAET